MPGGRRVALQRGRRPRADAQESGTTTRADARTHMNAMRPTAVAALLLLAACGSNDGGVSGPTPPAQAVPKLTGTYTSTNSPKQFNRSRDGYHGSWDRSGNKTPGHGPGPDKVCGFAGGGEPGPAVLLRAA